MYLLSKENEKTQIINKKEIVGIRCDFCKQIIKPWDNNYSDDTSGQYFSVTTGHNDWGNDSIDSIEHFELCPKCAKHFTINYLNKCHNRNTDYIEIYNKTLYKEQYKTYDENGWNDKCEVV